MPGHGSSGLTAVMRHGGRGREVREKERSAVLLVVGHLSLQRSTCNRGPRRDFPAELVAASLRACFGASNRSPSAS